MKFQAATSVRPVTLWILAGAVVLLAGEAARLAGWPMLAFVAFAALVLAVVAWLQQTPGERGLAVALVLLGTATGIAAGLSGHTRFHADALQAEALRTATDNRYRVLTSAVAAARHTTGLALQRVGTGPIDPRRDLSDLIGSSAIESAIAVLARDTVVAMAGPFRLQPLMRAPQATLVSTPFARMLVIRETRNNRQAQVVLLLDSLPGLPVAGRSLAAAAGDGVTWEWTLAADQSVDFATTDAAVAGVVAAMRPVAAPVSEVLARQAVSTRLLVGSGLLLLAVVLLLTTTQPAVRAAALLLPLWALARSDVGRTLFGIGAIRAVLVAAALMLLAIVLWRRPGRRTPVGLAASVLLVGTAPFLVVLFARRLVPQGQALALVPGFGWEAIVALTAGAFLAIAMAPLRADGDQDASAWWGIVATLVTILIGLIGIEAWGRGSMPAPGKWAAWYPPLWLLPIALQLPRTTPRSRLVALATVAGVLAALATWSVSLERRIDLAAADLHRLTAPPDARTLAALDSFAVTARTNHATRLNRLYATWRASQLATDSVPTYLSLWSAAGRQREFVALDSLSVSWNELDTLVQRAGNEPQRFPLSRRVGHHEVLILPLAPDTIATVTVGPRSRMLVPTTFGLLVGWRSLPSDPPYRIIVPQEGGSILDGKFRRTRRFVRADTTAGDPPRVVRAEVEMSQPPRFLSRAALVVLLDVALILASWFVLRRLLGERRSLQAPVFRRSYRRTVAATLMAFFFVPVIAFTLVAIVRLQGEAKRQHEAELATAVRIVQDAGGLSIAEMPKPRSDLLAQVADTANAALGVYRDGRLVASSDSMLAGLGLMPPILSRHARASGASFTTLPSPLPGAALRLGVIGSSVPGVELLVALPGGDTGLASEQIDQALVLLLATLAGLAASMIVAGVIARALGRPIETLRRTAVAIGRHETAPEAHDVPAEFVPVFGAIAQMEHDLRSTEAELQAGRTRTAAILSTVATGVIGVDASGAAIHVNPRATELLGREIALGVNLASQLPAEWAPIGEGMARLLGNATRAPESRELEVGEQRVAVTLAPLADGGLVLAITDITEASRAARVLAWGEMARQVAHEIKNPLTPMRLGLQHLRRVRDDRAADFPQLVDDTAERLLVEIERLDRIARSFARYGAPPERATPLEPIALKSVADELASLFALGNEPLRIEVKGSAAEPVMARREELVQVLLNLIDNARQAGAASVRLILEERALHIEDDGGGIPADQLSRIFEPSFSTNTSGTGLGLAIVRRLVEGWGASISVESTAGAGAVFTIRFAGVA